MSDLFAKLHCFQPPSSSSFSKYFDISTDEKLVKWADFLIDKIFGLSLWGENLTFWLND